MIESLIESMKSNSSDDSAHIIIKKESIHASLSEKKTVTEK